MSRTYPIPPGAYRTQEAGAAPLEQLWATRHTGVVAVDHGRALAVITGVAHSSHARLPADG